MTLDPSTLITGSPGTRHRVTLDNAQPEVTIEPGANGATVSVFGACESASVGNDYAITTPWTAINGTLGVGGARVAVKRAGRDSAPLSIVWS